MKRIICPTDFSATAANGIQYAAKLCQTITGTLTLYHVEKLMAHNLEEAVMGREFNERVAQEQMLELQQQIERAFHISVETEIDSGQASVLKMISNRVDDFDLIVMGTHGASDLVHYLIGSQTYRIIRQTRTPLLLVPQVAGFVQIDRVLYGYDMLNSGQLPLKEVSEFVRSTRSELEIVQVNPKVYSRSDEVALHTIHEKIRSEFPDLTIQFHTVYSDEIVNTFHRQMTEAQADVLALCTANHGFLEGLFHKSTIKAMTVLAEYPVLIVHG